MKFQKGNKFAVGNSGRFKKGHKIKQSEEAKKKRVQTILKNNNGLWPSPFRGKHLPEHLKKRLSKLRKGKSHWNWKGGITPENSRLRSDRRLRKWKKLVFDRAKGACEWCGERKGRLECDHIKSFRDYPHLRFKLSNGRLLCSKCHKNTDTFGGVKKVY